MEFCPGCGMLLQIQPATGGNRLRFYCPTCPYVCPVKNKARLFLALSPPITSPPYFVCDFAYCCRGLRV